MIKHKGEKTLSSPFGFLWPRWLHLLGGKKLTTEAVLTQAALVLSEPPRGSPGSGHQLASTP